MKTPYTDEQMEAINKEIDRLGKVANVARNEQKTRGACRRQEDVETERVIAEAIALSSALERGRKP